MPLCEWLATAAPPLQTPCSPNAPCVLWLWAHSLKKPHMLRIIHTLQQFITVRLYETSSIADVVDAIRVLGTLSTWLRLDCCNHCRRCFLLSSHTHIHTRRVQSPGEANEAVANDTGKRIVHWSEFYNDVVNDDVNLRKDYHDWMVSQGAAFTFCGHPYVLDAASKAFVMSEDARRQMSQEFRSSILR